VALAELLDANAALTRRLEDETIGIPPLPVLVAVLEAIETPAGGDR
jgi:hypothetical protein